MKFPKIVTIANKYGPAMEITDQDEADLYFADLVEHSVLYFGLQEKEAEDLEKQNLGYFAGYYDHETRARVERLFNCEHPVFGSISEKGAPTTDEAFIAGVRKAAGLPGSKP